MQRRRGQSPPRSQRERFRVNDVQPITPLSHVLRGVEQVEISCVVAYLAAMVQRVSAIAGWLAFAFIVYATLSPIDDRPVIAGAQFEHFVAFAVVGLAFGLAYPKRMFLVVDHHIDQRVRTGGFATADAGPSCPPARCAGQSGGRRLRDRHRSAGTADAKPKSSAPANRYFSVVAALSLRAV